MQAPGPPLRKVVLSRPLDGRASTARSPSRRCCAGCAPASPTAPSSPCPSPDGTFFGATPELLVARHGDRVTCHPLAGTVARGDTARADADAQGGLAALGQEPPSTATWSTPSRPRWRPFCDELSVPEEPSLVAFRSVAHLGTRIEGRLARPRRRARAARAPPPDPGRRRHARAPRRSPSSRRARPASGATGPGPVGWAAPAATASG